MHPNLAHSGFALCKSDSREGEHYIMKSFSPTQVTKQRCKKLEQIKEKLAK